MLIFVISKTVRLNHLRVHYQNELTLAKLSNKFILKRRVAKITGK